MRSDRGEEHLASQLREFVSMRRQCRSKSALQSIRPRQTAAAVAAKLSTSNCRIRLLIIPCTRSDARFTYATRDARSSIGRTVCLTGCPAVRRNRRQDREKLAASLREPPHYRAGRRFDHFGDLAIRETQDVAQHYRLPEQCGERRDRRLDLSR